VINSYNRTPKNPVRSQWATNTYKLLAEIKHYDFFTQVSNSETSHSWLAFFMWKDKRHASRVIKAFCMEKSLIFIVSITSNYHTIIFIPTAKHLAGINRHTSPGSRAAITSAGSYLHPKRTETVKYEECINYRPDL